MKKLLVFVLSFFVFAGVASATEGSFDVKGSGISCKATSVWHESRYRVIGRCDGLVYPFQTAYEYYSVWAHNIARNTYVHIDDVDRGYFEDSVTETFDKILITAEMDASPRRPSTYQIAVGSVEKFSFDKSDAGVPTETTSTSTLKAKTAATTTTLAESKTTTSSATGTVIGKILTSLLVIVLVIVAIVVVGSLIFRKRGSVSA